MVETTTKLKEIKLENNMVQVIIFKMQNADVTLLEKPMINWVKDATEKFETKVVEFNSSKTEFEQIKSVITQKPYTMVLYSFCPLLTQKNVELCLDYVFFKGEKIIKLPHGYVFETSFFNTLNKFENMPEFSADASEFLKIETENEIGYATEILQRRIIQNLILNGVKFINPSNVVINAFACIESGATIYPFNTLSGDTVIKKDAVLKEGNTIVSSEIGAGTIVANSIIKNSTICSNCIIYPFNTILENSFVGANCVIKSYNKISNAYVGENTNIESFNNIGK